MHGSSPWEGGGREGNAVRRLLWGNFEGKVLHILLNKHAQQVQHHAYQACSANYYRAFACILLLAALLVHSLNSFHCAPKWLPWRLPSYCYAVTSYAIPMAICSPSQFLIKPQTERSAKPGASLPSQLWPTLANPSAPHVCFRAANNY